MIGKPVSFQQALSWLNDHLGDKVGLSVGAGPSRHHRNWAVQTEGILGPGPGERQLIDHLGGAVRDYMVGETRVQLVEDDLVTASIDEDNDGSWLHLDLADAQINFGTTS